MVVEIHFILLHIFKVIILLITSKRKIDELIDKYMVEIDFVNYL